MTLAAEVGETLAPSRRWYDNELVTAHCCDLDEGCDYGDRCNQSDCGCDCETCTSMTDELLAGTSAIEIDDDSDESITTGLAKLRPYVSDSPVVVLLSADRWLSGDDAGEILLVNPTVARVIA